MPELSVAHVPLVRKDIQARRVHIVLQTGVGNVDIHLDITHAPFYFVYFAVGFYQSYELSDMARPICSVVLSSGQTRCFPATITP